MKNNPIILIDDDKDDCESFIAACIDLGITNKIVVFNNSGEAFDYLNLMVTRRLLHHPLN